MIILGIDPGTKRMGYGVIESRGGKAALKDAGILTIKAQEEDAALAEARTELLKIVDAHNPEVLAIEKIFFMKNRKTGIQVAQARGVALEACAGRNLKTLEFSPNEVKLGLTGYGSADKEAVAKMVRLTLKEPKLALIDDAMDALAIAIVAANHLRVSARLA